MANEVAEIKVYGFIGSASNRFDTNSYISAAQFAEAFAEAEAAAGDDIHLRIHSYGGSIGDGNAIQTLIANSKKTVTAFIDGVAASMGYGILLSCDKIVAASNAMILAHNANGGIEGSPEEIAAYATYLAKCRDTVAEKIAAKTGMTAKAVTEKYLMADNWFSAAEALEAGLIDEIDSEAVAENVPVNLAGMTYKDAVNAFNAKQTINTQETFLARMERLITDFVTGKKTVAENVLSDSEEWTLSYLISAARTLVDEAECLVKNSANPALITAAKEISSTGSKYVIQLVNILYGEEITEAATARVKSDTAIAKITGKKIAELKALLAADVTSELAVMKATVTDATAKLTTANATITAKETEITQLKEKLAGKPVNDKRPKSTGTESAEVPDSFKAKVATLGHNLEADAALASYGVTGTGKIKAKVEDSENDD